MNLISKAMAIEEDYYKSPNNNVISKIDCDNINSNVNGLNLNSDLDSINNDLTASAKEGLQQDDACNNGETINVNSFGNGFDKNKDFEIFCNNLNNNEGGIPGPRGPPGEAGPSQILPTNIYQVVDDAVTSDVGGTATSIAVCDEGDVVLSGSYLLDSPSDTERVIDGVLTTLDRWHASAVAIAGEEVTIQSIAQCFDNPAAHIP